MYAFFYRKRLVVIQEHALNRQLESNAALKLKKSSHQWGIHVPLLHGSGKLIQI